MLGDQYSEPAPIDCNSSSFFSFFFYFQFHSHPLALHTELLPREAIHK